MNAPQFFGGCRLYGRQSARSACCAAALAAVTLWVQTASAQTIADFFSELAKPMASDGAAGDAFGQSVSIDGETMVVGARRGDGQATNTGSAYVFERGPDGLMAEVAELMAPDGSIEDHFGASVSVDADTIVVGARYGDGLAASTGKAYVFERQANGAWLQVAALWASDGLTGDDFGYSVCISGGTIVVGAPYDEGSFVEEGSAYVFQRQANGAWPTTETAKLKASIAESYDRFGYAVSIDGGTIVVGARSDSGSYWFQGSAYVFEQQANGSWPATQTTMLLASDPAGYDNFGTSVSIDGGTIVVGAEGDDTGTMSGHGSAYVFERQANGSWPQIAKLIAADQAADDNFGNSISIDAGTIVVGAQQDDTGAVLGHGSAYVFERRANGTWPQTQTAKLEASDASAGDNFGGVVSVDGSTIVVGAHYNDDGSSIDEGRAYVFGTFVAVNLNAGNIGYTSLSDAIADALPGEHIAIRNQALQVSGILDASAKPLTFVGVEPLALTGTLMLVTADGSAFVKSPDVPAAGLSVIGTLVAPAAGSLIFEDLTVSGSGRLLQQGATLLVYQDCLTENGGTCYLNGHVLANEVSTDATGENRVAEDTDIFCDYNNAGVTIVQRGTLYIYGNLTNTGTMTGDINTGLVPPTPGDGFNIGGDYVVGANASLIMPNPVWWLRVGGNLDIAINDPARFVMDQATIELTGLGVGASQSLEALSADLGAVTAGFATSNFPIGALQIRAGAAVRLVDTHVNTAGGEPEVIYAHALVVPAGATLITNGVRVYAESATINGTVSNPNDIVIVTGTPPCPADLSGDGVVNGQDLGVLLVMWGPCGAGCPADINTDGAVNGIDLGLMLTGWGSCSQ